MKSTLTNQDLLDRYIHAISMMLPPARREDIAAEVRSNLESQIDDQAMSLGRNLRADEVSAILKQHGHPVKVAHQYREQPGRGLISPALFPLYWFTLRAVLVLWVTIRVIVAVFTLQGTSPASGVLLALGRDVLLAVVIIPAFVTLLFAVWEYLEVRFRYSERWKPEALAPVPRPGPQPKPRPAFYVISGVAWLIFWALALFSPWFFWVWGGRGIFSPSEALYAMRLPLWLLAFFGISQSWLAYTRSAAARWRQRMCAGVTVVGVALAMFLLWSGDLLVPGPKWDPAQARSLATLNQMLSGVLAVVCILAGLVVLRRFIRIARRWGRHPRAADSTS